jgi:hypothetical protein
LIVTRAQSAGKHRGLSAARLLIALCLAMGGLGEAYAAGRTIYFSATATHEEGTGETPDEPYAASRLNSEIRHAETDTEFVFLPGTYRIAETVKIIPEHGHKLVFTGAGAGVKIGSNGRGPKDFPLFLVGRGELQFRNFEVTGFEAFIRVLDERVVRNVVIEKIAISVVRDGIVVQGDEGLSTANWLISEVRISDYERAGIRLAGAGVAGIAIDSVEIDGTTSVVTDLDCYRGGIQIYAAAHDISVRNSFIGNNVSTCGKYHQGDGIEVSDDDGTPYGLTFQNLRLSGNRDGNLDLKAKRVTISNIRAERQGVSRFAFRFWNYPYVCRKCASDGGEDGDVFIQGADVTFAGAAFPQSEPRIKCGAEKDVVIGGSVQIDGRKGTLTCVPGGAETPNLQ